MENIDVDKDNLKNIDIDMAILENIDNDDDDDISIKGFCKISISIKYCIYKDLVYQTPPVAV